jgi:hypothetical protein
LWVAGGTLPWAFDPKAVAVSTEDTLTLRPTTQ